MEYINQHDIQQLVQEPSPATRASIASKISQGFDRSNFTESENKIVLEIFRLLLDDTSVKVRAAIADNLKNNPSVPKDIMNRLARDVNAVSMPILEFSSILSDEELIEIARETNALPKLQAIARRINLSGDVSSSLIAKCNGALTKELINNKTSQIFESDMLKIFSTFEGDKTILSTLVHRGDLSATIAESIYSHISGHLKKQLISRYNFSWKQIDKATELINNTSVISFLSKRMDDRELRQMIMQMHRNNRLNYSLILRALCVGEIHFFEMSLSVVADTSIDKIQLALTNNQNGGFRAIFKLCSIPVGFEEATLTIYNVIKETSIKKYPSKIDFQQQIIESIVNKRYHVTIENMSYFLSIMRQQIYGRATIH